MFIEDGMKFLPAGRDLRKAPYKQHPMLSVSVIVDRARHALVIAGDMFDFKAHARVKCDGFSVHGRSDTADRSTTTLAGNLEESLVELETQALLAKIGMDAHKVNIGLVGEALRNEAREKANDPTLFLNCETGVSKIQENSLGNISAIRRPPHHSSTVAITDE
jgi:hypothetical protein